MNATPAGWYDDPEEPGQQRYWDGTTWTEQRQPGAAPASPAPNPPPPPGAPASPPPPAGTPPGAFAPPPATPPLAEPAKSSRKVLWIVLAVVGVVFVLLIVAIAAITFLGDDATDVVEENLPAALETNLRANGLDVTVDQVDCDDISNDEGPFTTSCDISIAGLAEPLEATVYGTIDGTTVNVDDVQSDQRLINTALATEQAQIGIDTIDPTVTVESCTLPGQVILVTEGLTFTCDLDTDETVTFEVSDGQLTIQSVE